MNAPTDTSLFDIIDAERQRLATRKGYRLRRLEVKNFGGYHGPASVFNFDLNGAVFSGDNGAGKSTVIDAYRMLFRTHPRFNSATQEQSKDRTVETYYLGQYGKKDTGSGTKNMTLREHGVRAGYMAVCGIFETDAGELFTILRMAFYPKKGESVDWRLITAKDDISIERDFPEWPTKGVASRAAEALNGQLHSTFRDFFAATGLAFGIDNPEDATAAFRFLDESIGVKKMTSITGFARDNIFPRTSLKDSADAVITTFEEIRQSIQAVERCEAKINVLTDVQRRFKNLDAAIEFHEVSVMRRARFEQYASLLEHGYWGRRYREALKSQLELEKSKNDLEDQAAKIGAEIETLKAAITSNNFDKIDDYIAQKREKEQKLNIVASKIKRFTAEYKAMGLNFRCKMAEDLEQVREELTDKIAIIEERRTNVSAGDEELRRTLYRAEEAKKEAGEVLESLLKSKSAIDPKMLHLRSSLAKEFGLREDELPFLAELVQIRDGEEAWEGVANRILGGVGCEVLIDASYAKDARIFVNAGPNGSGKHNWGTKVILREVYDMNPSARSRVSKATLAGKLEVNPESAFAQVARSIVDNNATHECVSQTKFSTCSGDACTKEGSVMRGGRLIKDDRRAIDDRSSYVLGWNVQDRIDLARKTFAEAEATFVKASDEIEQVKDVLALLNTQRDSLKALSAQELNFFEFDAGGLLQSINELEGRISALDCTEAQNMRANLQKAEAKAKQTKIDLDTTVAAYWKKTSTLENAQKNLKLCSDRFQKSVAELGVATFADRKTYRDAARQIMNLSDVNSISNHILNVVLIDISTLIRDIRRKTEATTNSELQISNRGNEALRNAEGFLREYPEEGSYVELDSLIGDMNKAESLARARMVRDTWMARLDALKKDDLPRHKEHFESRHKTFAKDTIETIKTQVNAYHSRLNMMQNGLNSILKELVYDPMENTRARLRIRPSTDNDMVVKFRSRLDDAIKHLYADPEVVKAKTQRVIDMINDETSSKGERQREAILNMTNWFEMDIEEYHADEHGEFIEQRRFWSGKDGESGGQGERLTMLLIGAGLAYTFGLHDETRSNTGLQTIVLDEAFMHGSEEMAAAAMEVLGAMGLQVIAATPVTKLQAFAGHAERIFDISKNSEQIRQVVSTYAQISKRQALIEKKLDDKARASRSLSIAAE